MKKLISLSVVVMFSVVAFAQDTTQKSTSTIGKDSSQRTGDSTVSQTTTNLKRDSAVSSTPATTAPTNTQQQTATDTTASTVAAIPTDRVIMKDDKMYIIKSGDSSLLDKSYKLESGAVVSTTGAVKYPSGKTAQLKNGQFIELKKPVSADTKKTEATKKTTSTVKKKTN